MPEVRRATPEDLDRLTRSLTAAFLDDPVSAYIFPDAARRESILREFFVVQLSRTYLPRGEVYTTTERAGAAMWLPPDAEFPAIRDQLAYLKVSLSAGHWWTARRLSLTLQRLRPAEDHYYLGAIGVEPDHQRHGLGTALMRPGLERCDAWRSARTSSPRPRRTPASTAGTASGSPGRSGRLAAARGSGSMWGSRTRRRPDRPGPNR